MGDSVRLVVFPIGCITFCFPPSLQSCSSSAASVSCCKIAARSYPARTRLVALSRKAACISGTTCSALSAARPSVLTASDAGSAPDCDANVTIPRRGKTATVVTLCALRSSASVGSTHAPLDAIGTACRMKKNQLPSHDTPRGGSRSLALA